LITSGFNITALTREDSKATFPDAIHVYKTDYDSESSLEGAFKGQDAVVSVIATAALGSQLKIIEAAAKAGVKRFIPSEFGVNVLRLKEGGIKKILGAKIQARELLEKLAAENKEFTWTGISTNLFFDWVSSLPWRS
jgi:putative NADH-flavin reductase